MDKPAVPERGDGREVPPPSETGEGGAAGEAPAAEEADAAERQARGLVTDWVVTLFRPFPTAGDLDRLTAGVAAALRSAGLEADAATGALAAAVDQVAREIHAERHEGLYTQCAAAPCPALREAGRRAQSP